MTHTSRGKPPRSSLRRALNQKGAIGVAFAIGVTAVLGMGALATEAGIWLYQRRSAQDAADAAAYAGMVRFSMTTDANAKTAAAVAAATQVARINGFQNVGGPLSAPGDTRVRVQVGFVRPSATPGGPVEDFQAAVPAGSSANAVRVDIEQVQRSGFAQLISNTPPTAWGGAVAILEVGGRACTLSITPPDPNNKVNGSTELGGSTSLFAPNCLVASNAQGRKSINIHVADGGEVTVGGLRAAGQCWNCDDVNAAGGYISGAPQTTNPFAHLDNWAMPNFSGSSCVDPLLFDAAGVLTNRSNLAVTWVPASYRDVNLPPTTYTSGGSTYAVSRQSYVATCNTELDISNGKTLRLRPGTYFFNNSNITLRNGGTITCDDCEAGGPGVTLVFTGSAPNRVGTLRVEGGDFTLIAPGRNQASPSDFTGIVLYRDVDGQTSPNPWDSVKITGNPSSTLFGGIYVPTGAVEMFGTSGMNQTTAGNCVAIVAGAITFNGDSSASIDACEDNGTQVARVRYVRLVR